MISTTAQEKLDRIDELKGIILTAETEIGTILGIEPEDGGGTEQSSTMPRSATPRGNMKVRERIITMLGRGMKPKAIAIQLAIDVQQVYNTKSAAMKNGTLNTRGDATVQTRQRDEVSTFDFMTRERIKGMRDEGKTTREIADKLDLPYDEVAKVMSRGVEKSRRKGGVYHKPERGGRPIRLDDDDLPDPDEIVADIDPDDEL